MLQDGLSLYEHKQN